MIVLVHHPASHIPTYEPLSGIGRASPLDSPGPLAAVPAAGDKHPSPAIRFLIAGAFGAMLWTLLASLLIWVDRRRRGPATIQHDLTR